MPSGNSNALHGLVKAAAIVLGIGWGILESRGKPSPDEATAAWSGPESIDVVEEPRRIVFHWHGNIEESLRKKLDMAFDKYASDKRGFVLSLNSLGGSVKTGFQIIDRIKREQGRRPVDTVVETHSYCGSMCVGIYLAGGNRSAHGDAQFMFHEAHLSKKKGKPPRGLEAGQRDAALALVNRLLLAWYVDAGADKRWVEQLNHDMTGGHDVTLTARELVGQKAGIVDHLL